MAAVILGCALLFSGNAVYADQEDARPDCAEKPSPVLEQDIAEKIDEMSQGYPSEGRRIGTPLDVEWDLDP